MGFKFVRVKRFGGFSNLAPEMVDLNLFKAPSSEGANSRLEALAVDQLAGIVWSECKEELEQRFTVRECVLGDIFEFDDELVLPPEGFECILPVRDVYEPFLVRIKLGKEPLQEGYGQVQPLQAVLAVHKRLKVIEGDLPCSL